MLNTGIFVLLLLVDAQDTPHSLDSETGGLESYGKRLIFLNGKTKKIAFLFAEKRKEIYIYIYIYKGRKV